MCFPPCLLPHTCGKAVLGRRKWEHFEWQNLNQGWSFREANLQTNLRKEYPDRQRCPRVTWVAEDGRKILSGRIQAEAWNPAWSGSPRRGYGENLSACLGMDSQDLTQRWVRPLPRSGHRPHAAHSWAKSAVHKENSRQTV